MKNKVFVICILYQMLCIQLTFAQVKFRFSDGIYDQALKKQVENNVSALLTEINRADSSNRTLNLAKRKMSVTELANKVGITLANISVLKNGKAKAIRVSTLAKLCEALDCQPADLLEYRKTEN